ncbi:MAG: hypothetical protein QXU18_05585 [Thermoplasmatales archaeon]
MQIGNYTIPDSPNRLPTLIEKIRKVFDVYDKQEIKDYLRNNELATTLGYKSWNNGSYQRTVKALKEYGLIEGKGDLKVSNRAETILYGTEMEKQKSLLDAFKSIPLWLKLYEKFGKELPSDNFWIQLRNITGSSPKDAQDKTNYIREAYAKDTSVINEIQIHNERIMESKSKIERNTNLEQKSFTTEVSGEEDIATALLKAGAFDLAKQYIDFLQEKRKNSKNASSSSDQTSKDQS